MHLFHTHHPVKNEVLISHYRRRIGYNTYLHGRSHSTVSQDTQTTMMPRVISAAARLGNLTSVKLIKIWHRAVILTDYFFDPADIFPVFYFAYTGGADHESQLHVYVSRRQGRIIRT
ncbi:hypothetical protein V8C34DRAFT_321848 [Trichoderma compactum]